jgi:hypothetical protein
MAMGRLWARLFLVGFGAPGFAANVAALPLPDVCGPKYARVHQKLFAKNVIETDHITKNEWFETRIKDDLKAAVDERLNLENVLSNGIKPGERVYWVQQRGLKELNEKYFNIGGTEYLLMAIDRELSALLKAKPELGYICHSNYKDRVIVSTLSAGEFFDKIVKPVRESVIADIKAVKAKVSTGVNWQSFLESSTQIGNGKTLDEAFLSLHSEARHVGFDEWKRLAQVRRKALEVEVRGTNSEIAIEEILARSREWKDKPQELEAWATAHKLSPKALNLVASYREHLRAFDFLPIPERLKPEEKVMLEFFDSKLKNQDLKSVDYSSVGLLSNALSDSWIFQRSIFLKNARDSQLIIATDVRGLGKRGLIAQDRFVMNPATKASDLPHIYADTSRYLEERYQKLIADIRALLPKDSQLFAYRSGDDGLLAISNVDPATQKKIADYLREIEDLYSSMTRIQKPGDPESLARALTVARRAL